MKIQNEPGRIVRTIFPALLALILTTGCTKDPSLVAPTNQYSTSNYPASLDDLNSVLATCYSNLRDPNLYGFNLLTKALANCTHTANSIWDGDGFWNEMAATNMTSGNSYVLGAWQSFYTGIKNCNTLMNAADFYAKNFARPGDAQAIDQVRGQAYFLRAFYYFQLECYFGEGYMSQSSGGDKKGIPIFASVPTGLDSTQKPRSSVKDVWAFIESDLQQAATLLKGTVWTGNDKGRASEWAAKGLLGKAYVFTQDWANGKAVLLDVIQHSGKSLMPYAKYHDAFIGITDNEFNEESLFELNIDLNSNGDYGVYGDAPNSTSINGLIWCPWALGYDGTEASAIPLGYGNEIMHDKNVLRFGYSIGSYGLVDNPNYDASYKPDKDGYISDKWPAKIMDPAYKTQAMQVRSNQTADPRLFVNGLQPWIDSVQFQAPVWQRVSRPNFYANQSDKYGFSIRKYSPIFNSVNNVKGGQADGANIYLLRLADIYLLYAEACAGSGDNANALEYINKVKRRAYNYPVDAASPVDYVSLTDQTSAHAAGDPVLGNNPLYYERWAELFNEGHWWFDLCRWKLGASEAAFYGAALNVHSGPLSFPDKSYAWPIPLNEINSNNKITAADQNPGYN